MFPFISCGHELNPFLPEDLLKLSGPAAWSFSSLWTRSCRLALSRSKAWIVPCSVLTEALSPCSTASWEENNPCYSILDKILLFALKTMLWQQMKTLTQWQFVSIPSANSIWVFIQSTSQDLRVHSSSKQVLRGWKNDRCLAPARRSVSLSLRLLDHNLQSGTFRFIRL